MYSILVKYLYVCITGLIYASPYTQCMSNEHLEADVNESDKIVNPIVGCMYDKVMCVCFGSDTVNKPPVHGIFVATDDSFITLKVTNSVYRYQGR